jgi:hypothetical protein
MSNKVDKLFKEKLEEHSIQPSAQAWEKVEAHLGKKNRMVLWLRVAAAIAVMGLLTFVALNWNKGYEEPKQELVKKEEPVKEKSAPPIAEKEKPKEITKKKIQPNVIMPAIIEKQEQVEQVAIVQEPEPGTLNTELQTLNTEPQTLNTKGITLTYSLPPIKKQESPAEPVVAEEKKTPLERVLHIAKEVKNGDNALGDLREAKDQIFALDFKKDKDKSKKQ